MARLVGCAVVLVSMALFSIACNGLASVAPQVDPGLTEEDVLALIDQVMNERIERVRNLADAGGQRTSRADGARRHPLSENALIGLDDGPFWFLEGQALQRLSRFVADRHAGRPVARIEGEGPEDPRCLRRRADGVP